MRKALLALEDGTLFYGEAFGAEKNINNPVIGEIVFNTSMFGYQEVLTDPSYAGQMVCFSYPHIGNYGCNQQDMESENVHAAAAIIKNLAVRPSSFRSEESLASFLSRNNVMGICNLETRRLVQHIRDNGVMFGALAVVSSEEDVTKLIQAAKEAAMQKALDYVAANTCKEVYGWQELPWSLTDNAFKTLSQNKLWSRPHIVVLDCGVRRSDLRLLLQVGFRVSVVPAHSTYSEIIDLAPDALFVSDGAGDPTTYLDIQNKLKEFIGKLPIFGVGLGHQLIALAMGGRVVKLKFGRHGGSAVKNNLLHTAEVLAHNNDYVVEQNSLPKGMKVTFFNLDDGSIEGVESPALRISSIQFALSVAVGPQEAEAPIQRFFEMVVGYKKDAVA